MGDLNLNPSVPDESEPADVKVKSFKLHENYKVDARIHDIALIELDKEIRIGFTKFIRPACLSQIYPSSDSRATVVNYSIILPFFCLKLNISFKILRLAGEDQE